MDLPEPIAPPPDPVPAAPRPRSSVWAPVLVAMVLALLAAAAGQWEQLSAGLPRRPTDSAFRFAPSGNEWRLRRYSAFGVDLYQLRRTYVRDDSIDPFIDARAALGQWDRAIPERFLPQSTGRGSITRWAFKTWGWPMRSAGIDQFGRRRYLPLGLAVNALLLAPVCLGVLYLIRAPVVAVVDRFRIPPYACRRCRYDLRGLPPDAACPECGRARVPAAAAPPSQQPADEPK